jgi:hypothetical protein
MEMKLTTDQLCTKARYRERENVVSQWIAAVTCLGGRCGVRVFGDYNGADLAALGERVGSAFDGVRLLGRNPPKARRMQAGESCAQFMVRELDGSRRILLGIRWVIVLVVPSVLMCWLGGRGTIPANALQLDPSSAILLPHESLAHRHGPVSFVCGLGGPQPGSQEKSPSYGGIAPHDWSARLTRPR